MSKNFKTAKIVTRRKIWLTFIAIIVIALFSGAIINHNLPNTFPGHSFFNKFKAHLGLDLQGGTHLVYQADMKTVPSGDRANALSGVRDVIERRINAFGVSEPLVQTQSGDRLVVEMAGIKDVNQAIKQIGETPLLEFKEMIQDNASTSTEPAVSWVNTNLSGKNLKNAIVQFDQNTGEPTVSLKFDGEGKNLFAEITKRDIGKVVGIFLDGEPISLPTVQEEITQGEAVISGNFNITEAKLLAQRLNAGALPVPIELISQQTVGPVLGKIALQKSLLAGLIGLILVILFMVFFYRLPGLIASLALIIYSLIAGAIFEMWSITLTLSGIAGFILSIGMAVDANVLIFERTKEEIRNGKPLGTSIEEGFARAWNSIRDSNVSSLITCVILFWFGSSLIKGFAVTLAIGILISMFSAIIITRTFLRLVAGKYLIKHTWLIGAKANNEEK